MKVLGIGVAGIGRPAALPRAFHLPGDVTRAGGYLP
jgi:hypothetical protein